MIEKAFEIFYLTVILFNKFPGLCSGRHNIFLYVDILFMSK